jgi:hypothetical protein
MIPGYLLTHLFFILFTGSRKYNDLICYVSWLKVRSRVCSEYDLGFSGAAYQSYCTRLETEESL